MAKILVMGAGAVGGYFSAKLARGGYEVVFVARGENLRALRQRGLRVQSGEGDFEVQPTNAVATPAEAGRCDLVLVCVKILRQRSGGRGQGLRTWMLQDLERGRRLEIDALNGAVIRAAERLGIPVPTHRVLPATLRSGSSPARTELFTLAFRS